MAAAADTVFHLVHTITTTLKRPCRRRRGEVRAVWTQSDVTANGAARGAAAAAAPKGN